MNTDSFTVCTKINDIYKDVAKDVETRFDTLSYKLDRYCKKTKNNWIKER